MQPALSQVCTLHSPFDEDISDFAAGHCAAVEIWLTKLETFLESHSCNDVRRLLDQHGIVPTAASFQGGLLASQGDSRQQHWDHFSHRMELCRQLAIPTIVVACDVATPLRQSDIDRVRASLTQLSEKSRQFDVRVAVEFQASSVFGNNLRTMVALIDEVKDSRLGVCLDMFHFYIGPSKLADLQSLNNDNLFHVQFSDLADVPREFATDADRILPGDGDIDFAPVVDYLRTIGYTGSVSLELMNPQIWQVPARQFGEIGMTALRKILGLASM